MDSHWRPSAAIAHTLATDSGSVYLVNTNGTLLTTITNPTPAVGDRFGARMAMLGNDRVLMNSSPDSTTGTEAGSAYVFSVNGTRSRRSTTLRQLPAIFSASG